MSMKNLLGLMVMGVMVLGPVWSGAEAGEAPLSWKGRATVRVNVRKAPGKGAEIMTQVDQGDDVTVKGVRDGWYRVFVEGDTFGFEGWIYGKYITPAPGTDVKDALTETARAHGVNPRREKAAISEEEPSQELGGVQEVISSKTGSNDRETEMVTDIDTSKEGRFVGPPKTVPSTAVEQGDGMSLLAYEAPREQQPEKIENISKSRQISSPAGGVPLGRSLDDKRRIFPAGSSGPDEKREASAVNVRKKADLYVAAKTSAEEKPHGDDVYQTLVGVIIKLVVVAFSCLALLFAHRAFLTTGRARQ